MICRSDPSSFQLGSKRLIILDIDGTLLDARPSWTSAAISLCDDFKLNIFLNLDIVSTMCALGAQPLITLLGNQAGRCLSDEFWHRVYEVFDDEIVVHFNDLFFRHWNMSAEVVCLTNKMPTHLENILSAVGHRWGVRDIVCPNGVARKPSSAGLDYIIEKYRANRLDAAFVGDTRVDHEAALHAGLDYVHCSYGYDINFIPERAVATLSRPAQLGPLWGV